MSTINQIVIIKRKKYEVHEDGCVDNPFTPETSSRIGFATSLKKAIELANRYMENNIVEYGLSIDNSCYKISKGEDK